MIISIGKQASENVNKYLERNKIRHFTVQNGKLRANNAILLNVKNSFIYFAWEDFFKEVKKVVVALDIKEKGCYDFAQFIYRYCRVEKIPCVLCIVYRNGNHFEKAIEHFEGATLLFTQAEKLRHVLFDIFEQK